MRLRDIIGGLCLVFLAVALVLSCSRSPKIERPNIVLIVSDALRPDHLGCYGYGLPTSPTIDSLASSGILFETAVAQAPWTKASFSSMFTSLYTFQHGVMTWGSPMVDTLETLAEVLSRNGYETACVMNMIGMAGRFRVLQGFDRVSAAGKLERDAGISTSDAIDLMKESGEPFFLVLHYFDTHRPYTPGSEYYEAVHGEAPKDTSLDILRGIAKMPEPLPELVEFDMALFDAAIRYVDHCTERVLSYLKDSGVRDKTFVIFTADHGDALWEHGIGGHAKSVYDEEIRVPLIVAGPEGYWRPRRVPEQVELIDLYPTILELAGVDDHRPIEGMSLIPLITKGERGGAEGRFLPAGYTVSECTVLRRPDVKCVRRHDWKIIVEPSTARLELYNLLQDPGETQNLAGQGVAVEDTLLKLLRKVPGTTLGGWRMAFLRGKDSTDFRVEVDVDEGASIDVIDRLTQCKNVVFTRSRDGRSLRIDAAPKDIDVLGFTVSPDDAPLTFRVSASGGEAFEQILAGAKGRHTGGTAFRLDRRDGFGLPELFQEYRDRRVTSTHIWWLPGEHAATRTDDHDLTEAERKRLKALGYIQ